MIEMKIKELNICFEELLDILKNKGILTIDDVQNKILGGIKK